MMTRFAETYIGAGHPFVAPSRFGYLGSSLPSGAMPADQADAYALPLDALGTDRAAVFGYHARKTSEVRARLLDHPDLASVEIAWSTGLILSTRRRN